jgi:hypothetical protein
MRGERANTVRTRPSSICDGTRSAATPGARAGAVPHPCAQAACC